MFCLAAAAHAQGTQPVAHLELKQIIGKWYEIARLPAKAEKKCVRDAFVLFAEGNKPYQFGMVGSCAVKDGTTDIKNRNGRRQDKKRGTDGRLELSTLLILHTKLYILAIGPEGRWMVAGTPNHKSLWIYGQASTLSADDLAQAKSAASAQGFDVGKLLTQPQD